MERRRDIFEESVAWEAERRRAWKRWTQDVEKRTRGFCKLNGGTRRRTAGRNGNIFWGRPRKKRKNYYASCSNWWTCLAKICCVLFWIMFHFAVLCLPRSLLNAVTPISWRTHFCVTVNDFSLPHFLKLFVFCILSSIKIDTHMNYLWADECYVSETTLMLVCSQPSSCCAWKTLYFRMKTILFPRRNTPTHTCWLEVKVWGK